MITLGKIDVNCEADIRSFLELMEICLSPKTDEWFRWKYLANPAISISGALIYCARNENGKIIGVRPLLTVRMLDSSNNIVLACQPCDSAVHPDFQGLGVFGKLNRYAIAESKKEDIKLYFNFPNSQSEPAYLHLGWMRVLQDNEMYLFNNLDEVVSSKLKTNKLTPLTKIFSFLFTNIAAAQLKAEVSSQKGSINVRVDTDFTNEHVRIAEEMDRNRIHVAKGIEYLSWRYLSRPGKKYEIRTALINNVVSGYIITSLTNRWGVLEAQILEIRYQKADVIKVLLSSYLAYLKSRGDVKFVSASSFNAHAVRLFMRKIGFLEKTNPILKYVFPARFMVVNNIDSIPGVDFYDNDAWSIYQGDKDTA
jgi:hypothetical protein